MSLEDSIIDNWRYFQQHQSSALPFSMELGTGKQVVIFGGTHGNEPSGVNAIVNCHKFLKNFSLDGKVTFVLGNPEAYKWDQRGTAEENNLNRAFQNIIDATTYEGQRALQIREFFQNKQDSILGVLDLHSVSSDKGLQIVCYSARNPNGESLARKVSKLQKHFTYHPRELNGLVIDEAVRYGIPGMVVECGNHIEGEAVDIAMDHIASYLSNFEIIAGLSPIISPTPAVIYQYETIQAIKPGAEFKWKNIIVDSEIFLRSGEVFAHDINGDHIAPVDCYLMLPSKIPYSGYTDVGFLCKKNEIENYNKSLTETSPPTTPLSLLQ